MRMPEATLPLQWDLFKIADGHIQYRLVVDGSNRSIRFTVSDNNKYEIIRAEERFQKIFKNFSNFFTLMKIFLAVLILVPEDQVRGHRFTIFSLGG